MTNTPKKSLTVDLDPITIRLSSSEQVTTAPDAVQSVADSIWTADELTSASQVTGFFANVQQFSGVNLFKKISWTNFKLFIKEFLDPFYEGSLGYVPEDVSNKEIAVIDSDNTKYPSVGLLQSGLLTKQEQLVSGTNIKTINSQSVLGAGDLEIGELWIRKTSSDSTPYTPTKPENILFDISSDFQLNLLSSPSNLDKIQIAYQPTGNQTLTVDGNGSTINGLSSIQFTEKISGYFLYNLSEWLFFYQQDDPYIFQPFISSGQIVLTAFPQFFVSINATNVVDSKATILP